MSIYITLIRKHVEGTPEWSALIKTSSNGGEIIPCKNGSGKRWRLKKKEAAAHWEYYQGFFGETKGGYLMIWLSAAAGEKLRHVRARLNYTQRGATESKHFLPLPRAPARAPLGFVLNGLGRRSGTFVQTYSLNSSFKELHEVRSESSQKVISCISNTISNKITIIYSISAVLLYIILIITTQHWYFAFSK